MKEEDLIKELNLKSMDTKKLYLESMDINIEFTKVIFSNDLYGIFECPYNKIENLVNHTKNIFTCIQILNDNAKEAIQQKYSGDLVEDEKLFNEFMGKILLSGIVFYDDLRFAFEYPIPEKDSEDGLEYIHVRFDKDLNVEEVEFNEYYPKFLAEYLGLTGKPSNSQNIFHP
jgi:hypothetical protein